MYRIPFFIGQILSYFVPGTHARRRVRGMVNRFFFYIPIARFTKKIYGVKAKRIRFVRQINMNRATFVVNNRYYVKIFRNVSLSRLYAYKYLLDFIRPRLDMHIPNIFIAKHIPMYVADTLPGTILCDCDKPQVLKHERKIRSQIINMINALKAIRPQTILNYEMFTYELQSKQIQPKIKLNKHSVLAHKDLNTSNILLDDKFNIISIIDWDSLSIVQDPDADIKRFEQTWSIYKQSNR